MRAILVQMAARLHGLMYISKEFPIYERLQ